MRLWLPSKPQVFWPALMLALQFILAFVAYRPFIAEPGKHLFSEAHDGIKNYFHFQHFVSDTTSASPFLMQQNTNYPFGEYAMFTDITPSMAIPLKWVNRNLVNIEDAAIDIKHWTIVLNPLICSLLLWLILGPFVPQRGLLLLFCIALPWLHPQILRVFPGTLNLAWGWVSLLPILVLMLWHQSLLKPKVSNYQSLKWILLFFLIAFFAGLTHLYYLLMLGLLAAGFVLGSIIVFYQRGILSRKTLLVAFGMVAASGIALGCMLLFLYTTDPFYHLRPETAGGYDWEEWNLSIKALFRSYNFLWLKLPFFRGETIHYESHAYAGGFVITGFIVLIASWMFSAISNKWKAVSTVKSKADTLPSVAMPLIFGGLICFFTALGESFYYPAWDFKLYNIFNPLFYLHFITDRVEHFRCLGRFVWPFSWVLLIASAYGFSMVYKQFLQTENRRRKMAIGLIMAIPMLFLISDVASTIHRLNHFSYPNRLTAENTKLYWLDILHEIDADEFQAILPLPYFHVGSENWDYTIDGVPTHKADMFALSLASGLPLMAHQASRTPEVNTIPLFESLLDGQWTNELAIRLNSKPILVVINQFYYEGGRFPEYAPSFDPALNVHQNGVALMNQFNPQFLYEKGGYVFLKLEL